MSKAEKRKLPVRSKKEQESLEREGELIYEQDRLEKELKRVKRELEKLYSKRLGLKSGGKERKVSKATLEEEKKLQDLGELGFEDE